MNTEPAMSDEADGLRAEIKRLRTEADQLRTAAAMVWIYTDRRGEQDKLVVFSTMGLAQAWLKDNDPSGVAFGYPVISSVDDRRKPDRPH